MYTALNEMMCGVFSSHCRCMDYVLGLYASDIKFMPSRIKHNMDEKHGDMLCDPLCNVIGWWWWGECPVGMWWLGMAGMGAVSCATDHHHHAGHWHTIHRRQWWSLMMVTMVTHHHDGHPPQELYQHHWTGDPHISWYFCFLWVPWCPGLSCASIAISGLHYLLQYQPRAPSTCQGWDLRMAAGSRQLSFLFLSNPN